MDKLHELPFVLLNLLRGYATLSSTRSLLFPSSLEFHIVHDFLLNDVLLNELFVTFPPSAQYQVRFWKWALYNLECMDIPAVSSEFKSFEAGSF